MTAPERIWAFSADDIAENEGGATIVAHESYQPYAIEYVRADLATIDPACDHCGIDPAEIREAALWDLLEEIDAQIDLAEEISPEFAGKVQLALWAGQTKGAAE